VTPDQALALLGQLVANTRALPAEVDAFRQALAVLADVVNAGRSPDYGDIPSG